MKHNSATAWLVAAVCLGPFALALLLYYGPFGLDWLPQLPGSRELLARPMPLPAEWQRRGADAPGWQLIYARMSPCEQQCAQHLRRLLAVQLALGRDQDRVQRVVWHVGSLPELNDADLAAHALDDAVGRNVAAVLGAERMQSGRIFVADPRGEVVLSYPPDVEQRELLRDLKRLLAGSA